MIPHNRPCLGREEEAAAIRVLRSGWVAQGPEVEAFEAEAAAFLELAPGQAVAVCSGSAALYLALSAVGVAGEAVSAPGYGCRAVKDATEMAGAMPQWTDVRDGTPNVDLTSVAGTRVSVIAHVFGIPAPVPAMAGRVVIEDCAQALGAERDGRKVGTIGHVGVFSFAATKLITAGGRGGMVVSRDSGVIESVRRARDYDAQPDASRRFNFQMTDLQAAIGRAQLRKLPGFLERREAIWRRYRAAGAVLLDGETPGVRPVRFRAVVRTRSAVRWRQQLERAGVQTIVPITPAELLAPASVLPNAHGLALETVSLPIHPGLSDQDVERIEAAIRALVDA